MKAYVSFWLLSRGHSQFLNIWTAPYGSLLQRSEKQRECTKRRISNKTEVIDFYSLHLEVISSHICHIQFVESKSLDPSSPHLKRGNWTWVWIIIETKNHCVIFEGCLTHFLSRYRKKSVGAFLLAWYNYWLKKQQQTNKQNPSLPLKWITFYFY